MAPRKRKLPEGPVELGDEFKALTRAGLADRFIAIRFEKGTGGRKVVTATDVKTGVYRSFLPEEIVLTKKSVRDMSAKKKASSKPATVRRKRAGR